MGINDREFGPGRRFRTISSLDGVRKVIKVRPQVIKVIKVIKVRPQVRSVSWKSRLARASNKKFRSSGQSQKKSGSYSLTQLW